MRGLLVEGLPDAPTRSFREGLRVYPLSQADAPPAMEFISLSEREFNTIHANDVTFFQELDSVVQREPLDVIDAETRGLLASIGITKGTPFAPDDRMQALLTEAAAVANGTARAIAFKAGTPRRICTRTVHGRPDPSETTTGVSGTTAWADATSTPDDVLLPGGGQHAGHGAGHARRHRSLLTTDPAAARGDGTRPGYGSGNSVRPSP
jgi:hypothetical protein